MIITKLEQRDIPGCREIYNYYVKNTSFSLEETELTADQYEARVAGVTERFPFLVARDDAGNVAGFAYLSDFNPRSGYRHTADLSIYTAPDLRGVGLGAALLAVGMFLSSLTDNQGFAAGIGIAAILLNYYSVSLAEYTSSTAMGSLIALYVIALLLGVVIRGLTRNENLAYGVTFALIAALSVAYFVNSTAFEGLLPDIMTKLSLFRQFNSFVNGAFDLTAIVYYVSVMGFFLFLSVQSMEKRRYN